MVGSFFYEMDDVTFNGTYSYEASKQKVLPYKTELSQLPQGERISYYRQGQQDEEIYSVYGFKVNYSYRLKFMI